MKWNNNNKNHTKNRDKKRKVQIPMTFKSLWFPKAQVYSGLSII